MKALNEKKASGFFLFLGAIIILITIIFEYKIGWIGTERLDSETPQFMLENWDELRLIWAWQVLGYFLFILAYLMILKEAKGYKRLFWSILFIGGLLIISSFGFTLGSYFPALEVYSQEPAIFNSIRGGVGVLYRSGKISLLFFVFIFLWETFSSKGEIKKETGIISISIFLGSLLIGFITNLPIKVAGATFFLLPMVIGYFYWAGGNKVSSEKQKDSRLA